MVFYGLIAIWMMVITYAECVSDSLYNLNIGATKAFLIFLNQALASVLGLILTAFFIFHIWLISRGKTTLEYCEKKKKVRKGGVENALLK